MEYMQEFKDLTDEELVVLAQSGNRDGEEYLLKRYQRFVAFKVKDYYLQGGDRDDLIQEGMIGLFKGIHSFRNNEATRFRGFADLCIRRQVITAMRTANRLKNQPLNNYISFSDSQNDEEKRGLEEVLGSLVDHNPEDIVIGKERIQIIERDIKEKLSPLEWSVFYDHIKGESFEDISRELNMPVKAIYNAMDRSRKKISEFLAEEELG